MKVLWKWILQLGIAFVGILLISGLPLLITGFQQGEFWWKEYRDQLLGLFPISELLGRYADIHIGEYVQYSLEVLFLALIVAVLLALFFTVITMLCRERVRQRIKTIFFFLESIPDILIIMLIQLVVIIIHKQTGVFMKIAVTGGEKIYLLPVVCLMILPMVQLYRLSMLTFEAEERKLYTELARSLGFGKLVILLIHMFRNAIISIFFQSKKTMWFMLSNLFILERMFNMPGIMFYLSANITGELFFITVCSFFFPVFLLYSLGEWYFLRHLNKGRAIG